MFVGVQIKSGPLTFAALTVAAVPRDREGAKKNSPTARLIENDPTHQEELADDPTVRERSDAQEEPLTADDVTGLTHENRRRPTT
ncbi:hypothetical protein DFH08DRAFT_968818 [Mycena albidolilacea]|uniref:Uncharacterized protein n=1 Tax=Mycena albidolilacea TaxID=1033008 RepID=A0AAD6ZJ72_9AGAR|nr:hypothetical protein DFH08DRAFT_968818 [Mycena albidolilacea]